MRTLLISLMLVAPAAAQDGQPSAVEEAGDSAGTQEPPARFVLRLEGVTITIDSAELELILRPDQVEALVASGGAR